jgi:hypothetical protein
MANNCHDGRDFATREMFECRYLHVCIFKLDLCKVSFANAASQFLYAPIFLDYDGKTTDIAVGTALE